MSPTIPRTVLNARPPSASSSSELLALLDACNKASQAALVYFTSTLDHSLKLCHKRRVPVAYHPRTAADYDPRLSRRENRLAQIDIALAASTAAASSFDPADWFKQNHITRPMLGPYVQATNGPLSQAPVIGPDPHQLYMAQDLPIRVLPAPRSHRFGSAQTDTAFRNVTTVAQYKEHGRFSDFVDHLASGRLRIQDPLLDAYYLQKTRGNAYPVQRDFPSFTLPVRTPETVTEKVLTKQYEFLSEMFNLPVSHTINMLHRDHNDHKSEPAGDSTPFDFEDINETLQQLATLLDIDPETIKPDHPVVAQYMQQFAKEERDAFDSHCKHLDCTDVSEVFLEVCIAASHSDTKNAFKLQPDEIPVTSEWVKVDGKKMRDLRHVPPHERSRCVAATATEVKQLTDLGVFALVKAEKVPGVKPMESRIVWRVKVDSLGQFIKDKARLVMKGFQSKAGIGHFGVFSPMASFVTIRALAILAALCERKLFQADIPNAFGRSDINALVTASLPPGISFEKDGISSNDPNWLVRLLKSLYGLKGAPQMFHKLLHHFFVNILGYECLKNDSSLYGRAWPAGSRTDVKERAYNIVAADVDDMAILSSHDDILHEFQRALVKHFDVTDFGPMQSFFGVLFTWIKEKKCYFLSAKKQVDTLFTKHTPLITATKVDTPYLTGTVTNDSPLTEREQYALTNYRAIVGSLIFPYMTCRLDLGYVAPYVARYMANPQPEHVRRLLRCTDYLCHSRSVGLDLDPHHSSTRDYANSTPAIIGVLAQTPEPRHQTNLVGFTDASFAPSIEHSKRSVTGFIWFFEWAPLLWKSCLQSLTVLDVHGAELVAATTASNEGIWVRRLINELLRIIMGLHTSIPFCQLFGDNFSSVQTAGNPSTSARTRYLDIRHFKIREYMEENILRYDHLDGVSNILADFLTKIFTGSAFKTFFKHSGLNNYDKD